MARTPRRTTRLLVSLSILGMAANFAVPKAAGQEAGWITLFDGKSLDGWDQVGESNWRVEDGAYRRRQDGGQGRRLPRQQELVQEFHRTRRVFPQ